MMLSGVFSLIGIEDGIGYESCYKATQYNSTPSTPTSSNVDGSVPSGWYSTPPDISAVNAYVWESQRKKSEGSWGSWSTPKLKNRWANDGAQGGKGANGHQVQSICRERTERISMTSCFTIASCIYA